MSDYLFPFAPQTFLFQLLCSDCDLFPVVYCARVDKIEM